MEKKLLVVKYAPPTNDTFFNPRSPLLCREFVQAVISFPKPIVAAVNGVAIGLGVAILPLCDIIYASDKASFSCPYSRLAQTPEGCASQTFPSVMGLAMVCYVNVVIKHHF